MSAKAKLARRKQQYARQRRNMEVGNYANENSNPRAESEVERPDGEREEESAPGNSGENEEGSEGLNLDAETAGQLNDDPEEETSDLKEQE